VIPVGKHLGLSGFGQILKKKFDLNFGALRDEDSKQGTCAKGVKQIICIARI